MTDLDLLKRAKWAADHCHEDSQARIYLRKLIEEVEQLREQLSGIFQAFMPPEEASVLREDVERLRKEVRLTQLEAVEGLEREKGLKGEVDRLRKEACTACRAKAWVIVKGKKVCNLCWVYEQVDKAENEVERLQQREKLLEEKVVRLEDEIQEEPGW